MHSRPDFVSWQAKTFNAFLKDEYEYVVFNDATKEDIAVHIEQECQALGIRCIRVPQSIHQPLHTTNKRQAEAIQYSLDTLGYEYPGIVMLISSDMFLTKPVNINSLLTKYDFIGSLKKRSNEFIECRYAAPSLAIIDMQNIPDKHQLSFASGNIDGLACDTGAQTHAYFKNHPTVKIKLFPIEEAHIAFDEQEQMKKWRYGTLSYGMEFHIDGYFLHYYAGGCSWPGYPPEYHAEKTHILEDYLNDCLRDIN